MTGSVVAQVLAILAAPVVTRLYDPDMVGLAGLFVAVVGPFAGVACLRYELAVLLPADEDDAANVLAVSLLAVLPVAAISGLLCVLAGPVARLMNAEALAGFLWLVPIAVILRGTYHSVSHWSLRVKRFGTLSVAIILAAVVSQSLKILAGLTGRGSSGVLVVTPLLGSLLASALMLLLTAGTWAPLLIRVVRLPRIVAMSHRYRKFPLLNTWSVLINSVAREMPIWLLAVFFSPSIVGFMVLGRAVVGMPVVLIGDAINRVFFSEASRVHREGGALGATVFPVYEAIVAFAVYPFVVLALLGSDVFSLAFGARWAEAGTYVQILAPWYLFVVIARPLGSLFYVLERQGAGLLYSGTICIVRAVAILIGGLTGNVYVCVILYAATGVVTHTGLCLWSLSMANVRVTRSIGVLLRYLAWCAPLALLLATAKWVGRVGPVWLCLEAMAGAVVYYGLVFLRCRPLLQALAGREHLVAPDVCNEPDTTTDV